MYAPTVQSTEPSTPTTPRSFQNFVQGIKQMNRRTANMSQGQAGASSGSRRSRMGLLPILPNPFSQVHPALRSPLARQATGSSALPSPAPTAGRFSAMGPNPFVTRSSFYTHHAEDPTVLDYGGNVPIGLAPSRFVDEDDEEVEEHGTNTSERRWPSSSRGHRRPRKTRRRSSRKRSSVPILFPAMQSQRVRTKMLHSTIFASIIFLMLIAYIALVKVNPNVNTFQAVFVLIFILLAIGLVHSLVKLLLLVRRWNLRQRQRGDQESIFAPSDRAIPVILLRDEQIGVGGSASDEEEDKEPEKTVTRPPPAYGLWRGSVRADPNLLHWQRVQEQMQTPMPDVLPDGAPRPPSYTPPVQHTARMEQSYF